MITMEGISYVSVIRGFRLSRRMGQTFLVNADIARQEARLATGMRVVELGAGLGILTRELCAVAKSVLAIELDRTLFQHLQNELHFDNLTLVHKDFFELDDAEIAGADMLVSNTPYSLSSKTIMWACEHRMQAVLCLQREFVEHMLAKPGTRDYSRLSVLAALQLEVERIRDVGAGNFYPRPKVDSCIIRMRPTNPIGKGVAGFIGVLMSHKKRTVKSAVLSSARQLRISKSQARELSEAVRDKSERVFKLEPVALLSIAEQIEKALPNPT
jgi:16S rRNA (adenine1518-N6/adenine1519-N6)-dimethyltransferase